MAEQEWFEKDYYKVLGVDSGAEQKDIARAYKKLARTYHPDTNPGNDAAEEKFKAITAAYDVIGDATKRAEYDEVRRLGPMAGGFGPGGPGGAGGYGGMPFTFSADDLGGAGLGDLLGGLFGRGRRPGGGPGRPTGPRKGNDLETELHLSFTDAAQGLTTTLHLVSDATCSTCHGSGAKPGTSPVVCPRCAGRGSIDDNQGMFSVSNTCPRCAGQGMIVEDPCPTCHGSGAERRPRDVKVRIPPGVTDGKRIRLPGRGSPGANGGPPGDLFVVCRVAPHERFGLRGRDLTVTVPISFTEAALGADVAVPTLDGGTVKVRIPPGTPTGKTFRVAGKGVDTAKGVGDLRVTVTVAVPTSLTDEQRQAIEALAAASPHSPRDPGPV